MKQILCDACATLPLFSRAPLREGRYELMPKSDIGEPAEWARVEHGIAREPTAQQRTMYVNDVPMPLPPSFYNCDYCNADIAPGASAWCVTIWQPALRPEPPRWEDQFLTRP